MHTPEVRVTRQGPVTLVSIQRREARNAVDRVTAQQLADAFRAFDADPEAAVAVLHGEYGTFCAGADLKALNDEARRNRLEPEGDGPMGPSRMLLSKPVIAAISGHAVAGGLELALWCDLRVVERSAVLGVFCRRFGVPLIDGGTVRLPRLIGMGHAMDLILTGRKVEAVEALGMGLANRVVPTGGALDAALALAEQLAGFPQATMNADRMSAYQQWDLPFHHALHQEWLRGKACIGEGLEGAGRFADGQGRHGSFNG